MKFEMLAKKCIAMGATIAHIRSLQRLAKAHFDFANISERAMCCFMGLMRVGKAVKSTTAHSTLVSPSVICIDGTIVVSAPHDQQSAGAMRIWIEMCSMKKNLPDSRSQRLQ